MVYCVSVVAIIQGFGIRDEGGAQGWFRYIQGLSKSRIWIQNHVPKTNHKFCAVDGLCS